MRSGAPTSWRLPTPPMVRSGWEPRASIETSDRSSIDNDIYVEFDAFRLERLKFEADICNFFAVIGIVLFKDESEMNHT